MKQHSLLHRVGQKLADRVFFPRADRGIRLLGHAPVHRTLLHRLRG